MSKFKESRSWVGALGGVFAGFVLLAAPAGALDFTVRDISVIQATQTHDEAVGLVAGRRGLLRVFVLADEENTARPDVLVRFHYGRKVRHQITIPAPAAQAGVPTAVEYAEFGKTWNTTVPAAWIQPGLQLSAVVDPRGRIRETAENNNVWPVRGTDPRAVFAVPRLSLTMIPVRLATVGTTSPLTRLNQESHLGFTRRVLPVPEAFDVQIHALYTSVADLNTDAGWQQLLRETLAIHAAERGGVRFYMSVVTLPRILSSTIGGIAFLSSRASVVSDFPNIYDSGRVIYRETVVAHELGHNLSLRHAPCGGPANPEPRFPYPDGSIGRPGYDVFTGNFYDPAAGQTSDFMSYCRIGYWTSEFNYIKAMNWHLANSQPPRGGQRSSADSLVVWGSWDGDRLELEPAFRVAGDASDGAGAAGPYTAELHDANGRLVARQSFEMSEIDHLPGEGFALRVPVPATVGVTKVTVREGSRVLAVAEARERTSAGGTQALTLGAAAAPQASRTADDALLLTWGEKNFPLAVVRDAVNGQILAFARGGAVDLPATTGAINVTLSNGVDSRTVRVEPR